MMKQNYKFTVCTRCFTYNQASYINETLNGFAIQEVDFPTVYCIVDDSSTDGEQEKLRQWAKEELKFESNNTHYEHLEYGDLIVGNHKDNGYLLFVILLLKYNHYQIRKPKLPYILEWENNSKYIAICEGDDYWIDSRKLYKQVGLMERNPDCGLCYTRCRKMENGKISDKPIGGNGTSLKDLLRVNCICTLTTLFRSELDTKYLSDVKPQEHHWKMGDLPRWLWFAAESKIIFMDDVTAVYRILSESFSHSKSVDTKLLFLDSILDIQLYFDKIYKTNLSSSLRKSSYIHKMYYVSMMNGTFAQCFTVFKDAVKEDISLAFIPKCYLYLLNCLKR